MLRERHDDLRRLPACGVVSGRRALDRDADRHRSLSRHSRFVPSPREREVLAVKGRPGDFEHQSQHDDRFDEAPDGIDRPREPRRDAGDRSPATEQVQRGERLRQHRRRALFDERGEASQSEPRRERRRRAQHDEGVVRVLARPSSGHEERLRVGTLDTERNLPNRPSRRATRCDAETDRQSGKFHPLVVANETAPCAANARRERPEIMARGPSSRPASCPTPIRSRPAHELDGGSAHDPAVRRDEDLPLPGVQPGDRPGGRARRRRAVGGGERTTPLAHVVLRTPFRATAGALTWDRFAPFPR